MKKYVKKMLIRILILFFIITGILFSVEFVLDRFAIDNKWSFENYLINEMNVEKLQNKDWSTTQLWLHEGEELAEKKAGVKRILIIGDSFVWGDGYSNANHIWWQQFKHLLKENGYNNIEVIAAGVGGLSTEYQLDLILKNNELIEKVDPDLIIIGYVNNDPEFRNENYEVIVKSFDSNDLFKNSDNLFVKGFKNIFSSTYKNINILLSNKFSENHKFQELFGLNYTNWLNTISSGEWLEKYKNEVIIPLKYYMDNELEIPYFFYMTSMEAEPCSQNVLSLFTELDIPYYYVPYIKNSSSYFDVMDSHINPANWHPSVSDCKTFAELLLKVMLDDYSYILGEKTGVYEAELNINDWMPYSLKPNKISDNSYIITYPSIDSEISFLNLPINKNYIKLNLEDPLRINNIKISGADIEEIEIFINYIDKELGYDTQEMISLGVKEDNFIWKVDNTLEITSINISAKIKDGKAQNLTMTVE